MRLLRSRNRKNRFTAEAKELWVLAAMRPPRALFRVLSVAMNETRCSSSDLPDVVYSLFS
jgi:hypothetical protein